MLLGRDIAHDTTVLLYGRNTTAAARAAHLMRYAGVSDVRLLDGGFAAWLRAGLPCAAGAPKPCPPAPSFGAAFPGYPYISAKGDIPGARWGRAGDGSDVNDMSAFQWPDGSMRPAQEITGFWHQEGIHPDLQTAFYCGTGWRASVAFYDAWRMGWENISVHDEGWFEWRHSLQASESGLLLNA